MTLGDSVTLWLIRGRAMGLLEVSVLGRKVFPEGNQLIYGDQSRSDGVPLRHQKAKPLEISETGFFTGWTSFRRPINCVKALKV